jgi:pyruvate dehydrogenase E1 component alpha subunit|tara:strand:- start:5510 stop:6121 length:612 start_codon:yes stop_codon:yes gene_type:complete
VKKNNLIKKLVYFETKVAHLFNNKKIKAPIHLYYGNEEAILKVFEKVKKNDWVICSWRSHYQCLLKGVPENLLIKEILKGKSISLCFKKYKILSSAIVGGNVPIAVGVAKALKLKKSKNKVFCFLGDMTSETGIVHECIKYSMNYNLPIIFVIEDNNLSVCTDTRKIWKQNKLSYEKNKNNKIIFYKYKNKYPHAGAGIRLQF